MADRLKHRGPDGFGVWIDAEAGVALGHRRLSILDLSPEGSQPMISRSGRFVISFNGEIYNYREIRDELDRGLEPLGWRGHSDTEVALAAMDRWGVRGALEKMVGMFAIALWDRKNRTLILARDRMGEKPLYFGWMGNVLMFGSELKSLRAHPAWVGTLDRGAVALFLRHDYVPAPYCIHTGVRKVKPGTLVEFTETDIGRRQIPEATAYWSMRRVTEDGLVNRSRADATELTDELEALITQSVSQQMVADVPVGAFLSGGVDSSTVVALMQHVADRPVKTFTIGYNEKQYSEARFANEVARHLGTDHTELTVTAQEALDVVPLLPQLYDEPFADSSQIPTYIVARLARTKVTVSLSGDGGDELFGGYNRYSWGRLIWRRIGWMPPGIRRFLAREIADVEPHRWQSIFQAIGPILPTSLVYQQPGDKLHKLAEVLGSENREALYLGLVSRWKRPSALIPDAVEPLTALRDPAQWPASSDFLARMMYLDSISYLPDDILVKVDRAAMGVSLETRVPLLDHRIIEFASRLPKAMKVRGNVGKWILREVLYRHIPRGLIERPKMGFGVPIDEWLRGPLRDWAESLLTESQLSRDDMFLAEPIRKKWKEHLSGRRNWQYHLWNILMFQAWRDQQA
jgi:asparagine synthase (glutamine-hydrolysing)